VLPQVETKKSIFPWPLVEAGLLSSTFSFPLCTKLHSVTPQNKATLVRKIFLSVYCSSFNKRNLIFFYFKSKHLVQNRCRQNIFVSHRRDVILPFVDCTSILRWYLGLKQEAKFTCVQFVLHTNYERHFRSVNTSAHGRRLGVASGETAPGPHPRGGPTLQA
jgi:hypothetical protein